MLDLYSQTSDIKGAVKGEMTEDKLEVKDNLPLDTDRQTTSLFIEEREVKTQDGSTMISAISSFHGFAKGSRAD